MIVLYSFQNETGRKTFSKDIFRVALGKLCRPFKVHDDIFNDKINHNFQRDTKSDIPSCVRKNLTYFDDTNKLKFSRETQLTKKPMTSFIPLSMRTKPMSSS